MSQINFHRALFFLCRLFLVLILFLLLLRPPLTSAGVKHKQKVSPVKHLFGVGIGYQRVVRYKPVLVISKHKQIKHKSPGWGWGRGGGSKKGYAPIHIEQHVYRHRKGQHSRAPPRHQRKRPHHRHGYHDFQDAPSGGWGWAESRPQFQQHHQGYRRGHHDYQPQPPRRPSQRRRPENHHMNPSSSSHSSPPLPQASPLVQHVNGVRDNFPIFHSEVGGGGGGGQRWPGMVTDAPVDYPYASGHQFPYAAMGDYDEDAGAFETEIQEQWNRTKMPQSHDSNSNVFPLSEPPQDNPSMGRDFLRTHMKNFEQFQNFQDEASRNNNDNNVNSNNYENHNWNDVDGGGTSLSPPGPLFSTVSTDLQVSEAKEDSPMNYNYDYSDENNPPDGASGNPYYENDDRYWNNLNRKLKLAPAAAASTTVIVGTPMASTTTVPPARVSLRKLISSRFRKFTTVEPYNNKTFNPSPRMDEVPSKDKFFPSFKRLQL